MEHLCISSNFTGLCNQLFAFIIGIEKAMQKNIKTVTIGPFCTDLTSQQKISIDKIIDLEKTGNIIGLKLLANGKNNGSSKCAFAWYTAINPAKFITLSRCIQFTDVFHDLVNDFNSTLSNEPLHVVHFRIEDDAIRHWSRMNKMQPQVFKNTLFNHYKTMINKYIPPGSQILALTYDPQSPLLLELNKKYRLVSTDKNAINKKLRDSIGASGRECCAIVDLLVGSSCTGTFIGCHNLEKKRGSTFSYLIINWAIQAQKKILIDLDDISTEPMIY